LRLEGACDLLGLLQTGQRIGDRRILDGCRAIHAAHAALLHIALLGFGYLRA
jgi:hypothetical protein